jgi:RNA polymerase sigma-70 factor (ECF subfamily)
LPGEPQTSTQADPRLSRIVTLWTMLERAHGRQTLGADAVADAQRVLMQRYCGAVYRYLLGALRSEDEAAELFQEFALRFLRGDFRRADRQRGRFRDYLKTSLINLVRTHRAERHRAPAALPSDAHDPRQDAVEARESDGEFLGTWKRELMDHAWSVLGEENQTYHAVLLYHVRNPTATAAEAARELAAQLGKPISAGNVRVTLHRAREKFLDLLIEEVQRSLETDDPAALLAELDDLQLRALCTSALERRGISVDRE